MMLNGKRILLIIGGGIAAYKALDLIRRLQDQGASVRGILTKGGSEFITPLSVASLTGDKAYTDLFDLTAEAEMGHIRLSREADLVLVAPATADLMAKMANGLANDLASTALLATDKPVMLCPAMNVEMWDKPATQRNLKTLLADGAIIVPPGEGMLACGEMGAGRLAEVSDIVLAVIDHFGGAEKPLAGKHIVITAGPTHEDIDPVRYIANKSSGKQGYALAEALRDFGATITLVSGPTNLAKPTGITVVDVRSAREMLSAVQNALPADAAICVAAVADYRVADQADQKLKKGQSDLSQLVLIENPDILKTISKAGPNRPQLVVGFAAETEQVLENGQAKLARKGCDWIVANDVSLKTNVMGGDDNSITLIKNDGHQIFDKMSKKDVGNLLATHIKDCLIH